MTATAKEAPTKESEEIAALRQQNELLRAQNHALTVDPSAPGKAPIPDDLKPSGILKDVVTDAPENVRHEQKLYHVGIKDSVPFDLDIPVGTVNFRTRTARWSGVGEHAEMRPRNGAITALTDDEVKDVLTRLPFMYYRQNKHSSGNAQGIVVIDCSNGGSVSVDPVTQAQKHHPASKIRGRLRGDEKALAEILVFEELPGQTKIETSTVGDTGEVLTAAIQRQQQEQEDREAVEAFGSPDGMEKGVGGKSRRPKDLLKSLSTVTGATKKGEVQGGLLG